MSTLFRRHFPNCLTLLRLFLCPWIVYFLHLGELKWGFGLFSIAVVSDFFDGHLARRWSSTSRLGAFLDPTSDKVFAICFFWLLFEHDLCPGWFLALVFGTQMAIALGYVLLRQRGVLPGMMPSTLLAKVNTALQSVWITVGLVGVYLEFPPPGAIEIGYFFLAPLQLAVFASYARRAWHLTRLTPPGQDSSDALGNLHHPSRRLDHA